MDATLGGAGHARRIAEHLGKKGVFIGIDADSAAIERARTALRGNECEIHLPHANFRTIETVLDELKIPSITKALFDLGWSGFQLSAGRGFSFTRDEPLLMTYAEHPAPDALTAKTVVNHWAESSLADILYGWGEERYARRIAKAIAEAREKEPIATTVQLAAIVKAAVPPAARHGKTHPATKTFQALRIAVNDEMGALKEGIAGAWRRLKPGGRIAVISFHSVEDREVKHLFLNWAREGVGERITKSPLTPSREELLKNPRSRSAKLRVIEKI